LGGAWLIVLVLPTAWWATLLLGALLTGVSVALLRLWRRGALIPEGDLKINDDSSCQLTSAAAPARLSGRIVQAQLHLLGASLRMVDDAGRRHDFLILRDAVEPQALHALRGRIVQTGLPNDASDRR
jgi:hypothetical protein